MEHVLNNERLTFSDKINMLPRLRRPFEHVCVRKILRNNLATMCQIWSQRSADLSFESSIHFIVTPSGCCRSKNLDRYLQNKENLEFCFVLKSIWVHLTFQWFLGLHSAVYTTTSSHSCRYTDHCCTFRTKLLQDIPLALTLFFLPFPFSLRTFRNFLTISRKISLRT